MNILRFMTPKQDVAFIYEDFTLRQTLETWENHRYASIPVLRRTGEYVGTMTEGDILWGIKRIHGLDMEQAEETPISSFPRKRDYRAVPASTTSMEQLPKLHGCEAHSTVLLSAVDEQTFKRLGVNLTCEPCFEEEDRKYHK